MTNDVEEGRVHDQVYCSHHRIEIIELFWGPGSKLHVLENVACSRAVPELLQGLLLGSLWATKSLSRRVHPWGTLFRSPLGDALDTL